MRDTLTVTILGLRDYLATWEAMRTFTTTRHANTNDELWLVEHPAIFTLGQNAKTSDRKTTSAIPMLPVDRGGQITYHGPGQLMIYPLINIHHKRWTIRDFITHLELAVIDLLAQYKIKAQRITGAPGVYVGHKKICALGLRIKQGCSFHGLALNVNTNLAPFQDINPCGDPYLVMTRMADYYAPLSMAAVIKTFMPIISAQLAYPNLLINTAPGAEFT